MTSVCRSLFVVSLLFLYGRANSAERPNIIVIYSDDHGWADLGSQGIQKDIRTPHLDGLARNGLRATNGYVTAPQCVPSRSGLLVGKFQGRFNLDSNGSALDGFDKETTIATRLQNAGYVTAQFGKWHLGPTHEIARHGFKHVFSQNAQRPFSANIMLDGQDRPMSDLPPEMYHIESCSHAAGSIITRYYDQPFFLFIAFRAPHTPLDAPLKYTARFPGEMPERRRQALAMISAIDDGVGHVMQTLRQHGLEERTLIFFMGDNGAPLKIHKIDSPLDGDAGGWDGSLNAPMNGEKGMLSEGGIRVPWLAHWKGIIPGGQVYEHPVISLDVAATATALAGIETKPGDLDGVNLLPYFKGDIHSAPHDTLMWRWTAQSAIRESNWKFLRGGEREYLFDLSTDPKERYNLATRHPHIASRLRSKLEMWCAELNPPGLSLAPMAQTWNDYFDFYLDGKPIAKLANNRSSKNADSSTNQGWLARNGTLAVKDGLLELTPDKDAKGKAFLTNNQLKLTGPVMAKFSIRSTVAGQAAIAWRTSEQKDFLAENQTKFHVIASNDLQTHQSELPVNGTLIHLRIHLPDGITYIQQFDLQSKSGQSQSLWKTEPR